uniref:H/ACA ribonucleoprotein complex subunit 2 n=1 Tax=Phlebotomus kandelakii TaxID=1109342 RepID=A0A6B2EF35_9DIPT
MGKVKKESEVPENPEDVVIKKEDTETYEEKLAYVTPIAKPMASKKLAKKCFKLIKKATKQKTYLRNGLKDVQKRLRKGETGLVVFAGDVRPIDMICHLPAVCEEKSIPYVYVPSKTDLGNALGVKRASVTVLIREHPEYKELFDECSTEMTHLPVPT